MAKRSLLSMAVVSFLILMSASAWAVPTRMNYQGKLTDTDGNPLNGTHDMTFYLFTIAGPAIWSENHPSVTVTDGIYSVILGSTNPLATGLFIDNDQLYLEVEVDGETLSPRQQLTSAPYALKARVAEAVMDGAISTVMIADGAVDSQKLENDSVTGTKIADGTVSYVDIQDGATLAEIKDDDGSGSGLDADTLDTLDSSDFVRPSADYGRSGVSSNLYEGTISLTNKYVNQSGDDMTGSLTATVIPFGTGWHEAIKGSLLVSSDIGAGVFGYAEGYFAHGVHGGATGYEGVGVYGEGLGNMGEGVHGEATGEEGIGVYGKASSSTGTENHYGGSFEAAGEGGVGVQGVGSGLGDYLNYGGRFRAYGTQGRGVSGTAFGTNGSGVYGDAGGEVGIGVYGLAMGEQGKGVVGESYYDSGYAGYFEGRVHVHHSSSGQTPTNNTGLFVENEGNGNDFFVFQTATTGGGKSFSITNAGRVGIGTTSPGYKLDVAGRARMLTGSDNSAGIWFTNADDSQSRAFFGMHTDDLLGFFGQGGTPGWGLVFNVNDKTVGIGTDNPGSFKLAVNGSAAKPGGGTWSTFSDVRLKDIGERYKLGLEEIIKIEPVRYRYKEDNALGLPSDGEYVGLIAQEVQEVIPEAVEQNKQGYLMVNEGPINYAMLNAIKELSAEVKRLKKRIEELEKR